MRIAICDDDQYDQEQILQTVQNVEMDAKIECFSDGASLIRAAKHPSPFEIVFLDIYMPNEDGMQIARTLQNVSPRTGLVFVTSSKDRALEAFSLATLHYLVKPITEGGVMEAMRRLRALHPNLQDSISFNVGRNTQNVPLSQVCSLTSASHAVEIALKDGTVFKVWTSLYELEQKLGRNFLKINRGIIVNMDLVKEMHSESCIMANGQALYLAVRKRGAICAAYQDYLLDRLSRKGAET